MDLKIQSSLSKLTRKSKYRQLQSFAGYLFLLACANLGLLIIYQKYQGIGVANLIKEPYLLEEISCKFKIPQPFHPSIREFIYKPGEFNCTSPNSPKLFVADDETNTIVRIKPPRDAGFTRCCYRVLTRGEGSDSDLTLSKKCFPLLRPRTLAPPAHEFIAIYCKKNQNLKLIDLLWFVNPEKPTLRQKIKENDLYKGRGIDKESLNVFILGLDGVSEANFHRQMPRSAEYLSGPLKAIFMKGYNKLGDNTFPNVVPLLTGMTVEELKGRCWRNENDPFDSCPFIWKNFSSRGWVTSFAEDAPGISIFNYLKKGFRGQPTDFYLRPLTAVLDLKLGHNSLRCQRLEGAQEILEEDENCDRNENVCYGHRLGFQILLENLERTATAMHKNSLKVFHMTWATSLFHDHLNDPSLGDDLLRGSLERLKNGGYLEDSLLIICSDHGIRYGPIRQTVQGKMEERMPLLTFVLPEWFPSKYPRALANLRRNSQRLTTHFDLHETLGDLLDMGQALRNGEIEKRTVDLQRKGTPPRGQSLFLPVSPQRSCPDAGIDPHWCICNSMESLEPLEKYPEVQRGAQAVVAHINDILFNAWNVHSPEVECAQLRLVNITSAQRLRPELIDVKMNKNVLQINTEELYEIGVITNPGGGAFEASVSRIKDKWDVSEVISRTNLYGNQSWCVDNSELKKLCFCQN